MNPEQQKSLLAITLYAAFADGRVMCTAVLRDTFQNLLGPAKQMQAQYLPQIQQKASTLDLAQVMAMARGG